MNQKNLKIIKGQVLDAKVANVVSTPYLIIQVQPNEGNLEPQTVYFPKELILDESKNSTYFLDLALKAKEMNKEVTITYEEQALSLIDMTSEIEEDARAIGSINFFKVEKIEEISYITLGFQHYTPTGETVEILRNEVVEDFESNPFYRTCQYAYESGAGLFSIAFGSQEGSPLKD